MNAHHSLNKFDQMNKQAAYGLKDIGERIKASFDAEFKYDMGVISALINQSMRHGESIEQIIQESVLPDITDVILNNLASEKQINTVTISSNKKDQQLNYAIC